MKLIIAEKPSVARAISAAIEGNEEKKEGYIKKGDFLITWAVGHLLELKDPEDYDLKYESWDTRLLPFNFPNWGVKPIERTEKQLNVIKDLLSQCSSVIHSGDPDEEGQLLIDEILQYFGNTKPVERILINDNNTSFIKKALDKLEDNKKYESMGKSAYARGVSDKLLGFNMTRFLSSFTPQTMYVGRVQTPTLGLVVNRDYAIKNHIKQKYYLLRIIANNNDSTNNITFNFQKNKETPVNEDNLIVDYDFLNNIKNDISDVKKYEVTVTSKILTKNPPLLFNIDKLQAYCSTKYNYTGQEILDITNTLKDTYSIITYNRTDCQYLNEEHFLEAPELIQVILDNLDISVDNLDSNRKSRAFDSSKVTAHHGIIPTHTKMDLSKLTEKERNVYKAIAEFYLAQFLPSEKLKETLGEFTVKDNKFSVKGTTVVDYGYKSFLKNIDEEKEEEISNINKFEDGEYEFVNQLTVIDGNETKPPKPYTEATLLQDMVSIAKYVTNPEIKEILLRKDKDKKGANGSIGTPATRASIIEDLIKKAGYLERKGKQIRATELGTEFYNSLPNELKTADLTAYWWAIQEEIIKGDKTPDDLINSVYDTVKRLIETTKDFNLKSSGVIKCPKCNVGYLRSIKGKNGSFWGCSNYQSGCTGSFRDKDGKPDFTEKKPAEKSELKCPKDGGDLYKNTGKYGDYWRCGTCKTIYKDKEGNPDLSEKKAYEKSEHKCECGEQLVKKPTLKDPKKIIHYCEKCKSMYFEQADGTVKKWQKK